MLNLGLKKKGFKIGHSNIQGIQNKVEQIDLLLNSSENDIYLLGISESTRNSNHPNNFIGIKNYQLFRKYRILSEGRPEHGKGIIVYEKDDIKCVRRSELEWDNIECFEFFPHECNSFLVGKIYRHPNEGIQWNE